MPTQKQINNFQILHSIAQRDENILWFFLWGGRWKWFFWKNSDYDIYMIFKDEVSVSYKSKLGKFQIDENDILFFSKTEFEEYAINDRNKWNKYNFAHLKVELDRCNIQRLVDQKCRLNKSELAQYLDENLESLYNYIYRSCKHKQNHYSFGSHLRAVQTIQCFLEILFALDCRVAPYYKYLEWEIKSFPVSEFPIDPETIISHLKNILHTWAPKSQIALLEWIEQVMYRRNQNIERITYWRKKINSVEF